MWRGGGFLKSVGTSHLREGEQNVHDPLQKKTARLFGFDVGASSEAAGVSRIMVTAGSLAESRGALELCRSAAEARPGGLEGAWRLGRGEGGRGGWGTHPIFQERSTEWLPTREGHRLGG